MRYGYGLIAGILLMALPAQADAPTQSPRPLPRPAVSAPAATTTATAVVSTQPTSDLQAMRPRHRPASEIADVVVASSAVPNTNLPAIRPQPRPANLVLPVAEPVPQAEPAAPQGAAPDLAANAPEPERRGIFKLAMAPRQPSTKPEPRPKTKKKKRGQETSRKGSVCGDPAIKGEEIARITSKVKGCGVPEAVRVTSVSGVALSQAATIDCPTAQALKRWVDTGLQPAFGRTRVIELKIAAHYICRPRNNIRGNKISEHGKGKAVDISGIVLENGKTIMVAGGFGRELRRAHKAACGIFGTTLGPGSDGFHEDHLHFDTASHRGGPYCR
ncbi:MAG: extensin family protein [Paracoccaceae bacterium]